MDAHFVVTLATWLSKNKIWPDFGAQGVTQAMLWKVIEKAESRLGVSCGFSLHSSAGEVDHVIT